MGLADASFTFEHEHPTGAGGGRCEQCFDGEQLVAPADRREAGRLDRTIDRGVQVPAIGEALEPATAAVDEADCRRRADQLAHHL